MFELSSRPLLPTFLPAINALLAALALPFAIDHPTDLTPSLLLAIFESLINARLPIPVSVRQSRTRDAKTRAMLVLLGVLECDVLRGGASNGSEHSIAASSADNSALVEAGGVSVDGWVDEIGLGEVDPERLADGGLDETIFVGELLCWLARRKGLLPRTRSLHGSSHSRSLYSNHHSYGTEDVEHEGDSADFSTSLLLRPSSSQQPRSPRSPSPSPSPSVDDADPDSSAFSHIMDVPRHPLVYSPEHSFTMSATSGTDLSIRARSISSRTSVSNTQDELEAMSQDTVQLYDPRQVIRDIEEDDDRPPTFHPRCIHELEDPSYIRALAGPSTSLDQSVSRDHDCENEDEDVRDEQDTDDPYAPSTPTPRRVRLAGWIDTVDAAAELSQFAASRSHSYSRTFNTSGGQGPEPPSQSWFQSRSRMKARTSEIPGSSSRLHIELSPRPRPISGKSRTPLRISTPPPSPSPSPSPPLPTSSKHPSARSSSSPPPIPPSPPAHSDPPFDVSFSSLNNTSTPAKFRPPRRPKATRPHNEIPYGSVDRRAHGVNIAMVTGPGRHDRSPSYTPSPPSFTTPGSLRGGVGTRLIASSGSKHPEASTPPVTVTTRKKTSPSPTGVNGTSPPLGSTATTNTLLTERARLLTELAALKRARAASGSGPSMTSSMGSSSGHGGDDGVLSRRVGVGVRS